MQLNFQLFFLHLFVSVGLCVPQCMCGGQPAGVSSILPCVLQASNSSRRQAWWKALSPAEPSQEPTLPTFLSSFDVKVLPDLPWCSLSLSFFSYLDSISLCCWSLPSTRFVLVIFVLTVTNTWENNLREGLVVSEVVSTTRRVEEGWAGPFTE